MATGPPPPALPAPPSSAPPSHDQIGSRPPPPPSRNWQHSRSRDREGRHNTRDRREYLKDRGHNDRGRDHRDHGRESRGRSNRERSRDDRNRDRQRDRSGDDRRDDKKQNRSERDEERRSRSQSRSRSRDRKRRKKKKKKKKSKWDDMGSMENVAAAAQAIAVSNPGGAASWMQQQGQNLLVQQMISQMGGLPQQAAGSKKQRELYVGNLMQGMVTDDVLRQIFTQIFDVIPEFDKTRGPSVLTVSLNACGKYGFVEFRDEVCAATAVKFAGINLYGRALKIGRPSGYVQPLMPTLGLEVSAEILRSVGATNALVTSVGQQANKKQRELYVGNLTIGVVTAPMLKELFSVPMRTLPGNDDALPPVLNVEIAPNGHFSFVEFRTEELATKALSIFNNMEVCGRNLRVGRPSGYVDPAMSQTMAASGGLNLAAMTGMGSGMGMGSSMASAMFSATNSNMMPHGVPNQSLMGATAVPKVPPSTQSHICLENLVIVAELNDDEEYIDLKDEIQRECAKSGAVVRLSIPRPGNPARAALVGKAFVQYQLPAAAQKAVRALNGRTFDGKSVKAYFIDPSAFP